MQTNSPWNIGYEQINFSWQWICSFVKMEHNRTYFQTMIHPTKNDFKYLIQVCNYALTFRNVGTTFHTAEQLGTTKGEIENTPLVGAGDASWGKQPKSTLGYIGFIGEYNNLIKSKTTSFDIC